MWDRCYGRTIMVTTADTLPRVEPVHGSDGPSSPTQTKCAFLQHESQPVFKYGVKTSSRHANASLPLAAAFGAASVTCRIPHLGPASSATLSVLSATSSWQASPQVVDQLFPDPFPFPGSGNFSVAPAEIRDSNIFLYSSTRLLCGLHSKMLSWRAETNLTPLGQHISHEGSFPARGIASIRTSLNAPSKMVWTLFSRKPSSSRAFAVKIVAKLATMHIYC